MKVTVTSNNNVIDFVVLNAHFKLAEWFWTSSDKLLVDLHEQPLFTGKFTWSQLTPSHYEILLLQNLIKYEDLSANEQQDPNHNTVRSLMFLFAATVRCIELLCNCTIRHMQVHKLDKFNVEVSYQAKINSFVKPQHTKPKLTLVINNSSELQQ